MNASVRCLPRLLRPTIHGAYGRSGKAVPFRGSVPRPTVGSRLLGTAPSTSSPLSDSPLDGEWTFDYDVLVCGGGVVGTSFVSKLLHNTNGGLKIGLLEQKPPPSLESCLNGPIDVRVYALSPKSVKLLDSIGAWDLLGNRKQHYSHMQIWDANSMGLLSFSAGELGVNELGYLAEDKTINAAIANALHKHPHAGSVDMIYGSSITGISQPVTRNGSLGPAEVTVQSKDSSTRKIRARYVQVLILRQC
jgi:2-polyprenyl-6-methoxyphenol hydroxylase-like FAD-dependent oxidoreductase